MFLLLPEAISALGLVEYVGRELLALSVTRHGTDGHGLDAPDDEHRRKTVRVNGRRRHSDGTTTTTSPPPPGDTVVVSVVRVFITTESRGPSFSAVKRTTNRPAAENALNFLGEKPDGNVA